MKKYEKPKHFGGKIIRAVIKDLRSAGITLPITSHIHIAASGGVDSTALILLLSKYGSRVVSKSKINVVHVNHHWRGKASGDDAMFLKTLCKKLELNIKIFMLPTKKGLKKGQSFEEKARSDRKKVFENTLKETKCRYVFTAHQANDRIETLIWRFFTGAFLRETVGIKTIQNNEVRPFLSVPRIWIEAFLAEENVAPRLDQSNFDQRFLRAQIRHSLIPSISKIFPNYDTQLLSYAKACEEGQGALDKDTLLDFAASRISGATVKDIKLKVKMSQGGKFTWDIGNGKQLELSQNKSGKNLTLSTIASHANIRNS